MRDAACESWPPCVQTARTRWAVMSCSDHHHNPWNVVNTTTNAKLIAKAATPCLRYPDKIAWCAHVTDVPDDINIVMLGNRISQGVTA